jgi:NAD(P)-dependent dehydrogenase (short-subunit alcohol dehydrogenase family)
MAGAWLKEKAIVIIGGTTGIGLAAALAFVEHGAQVVVVGRNPDSAEKAASSLGNDGFAITADASIPDTAVNAIAACKKKFNRFDGLYHVAGGSGRKFGDGPLHEISLDGWNQTLSLNLTSLMLSKPGSSKSIS